MNPSLTKLKIENVGKMFFLNAYLLTFHGWKYRVTLTC
jgi:hypothetical protein